MTAADHERLIAREKPAYDGAEPSGTSVALLNALRLATFTSDDRWRAIADRAFAAIAPTLRENPLALTEALLALDYASDEAKEIAIVWPRDAAPTPRAACSTSSGAAFVPNHALAAASEADAPALGKLIPFIADKTAVGGRRHRLRLRPRAAASCPCTSPTRWPRCCERRVPYPSEPSR